MTENRAVSETYLTDDDDGDRVRTYTEGGYRLTVIDDKVSHIERTDAEREAFRAKMAEWRRTGGIPGYVGPRAAR